MAKISKIEYAVKNNVKKARLRLMLKLPKINLIILDKTDKRAVKNAETTKNFMSKLPSKNVKKHTK